MPTPTDKRRDLLTVIANMRAKPGKESELREALEALIKPTTDERGYVNYDLHQGIEDPLVFFFYENRESAEDLDAHLNTPHLQHFSATMGDLLDDGGLTITRLRRIVQKGPVSGDASVVQVVGPDQRDTNTGQTPGLRRFEAISSKLTGSQQMWMGYAVLEPDFIPLCIVHWEQNASDAEPVEMIVARSTQEAIVVTVDDHPHAPEHARRVACPLDSCPDGVCSIRSATSPCPAQGTSGR